MPACPVKPRLSSLLLLFLLASAAAAAQGVARSSVLAGGKWRKVSVEASGVYSLSASALRAMGFESLDAVRVYGAGGRQLSFVVGADDRDDLAMLPTVRRADALLFYAEGPDALSRQADGSYLPSNNAYSRKAYYYLTTGAADDAAPLADGPGGEPAVSISEYDNVFVYAPQTTNVGQTGREWVGARLSRGRPALSLPVQMEVASGRTVVARYRLASKLTTAGGVSLSVDGAEVGSAVLPAMSGSHALWTPVSGTAKFTAQTSSLSNVVLSVDAGSDDAGVWVAHLTLTAPAPLRMSPGGVAFRSAAQGDLRGGVVSFAVDGAGERTQVWDVTSASAPVRMPLSVAGSVGTFTAAGGRAREYVAFDTDGSFPAPTDEGDVANQDLHSHGPVNYLVVTSPRFAGVAERLCALHSEEGGLTTRTVFVDDIYNEFSAGRAEAPAIRNYIKMLYDRGQGSADALTHVLLLGSGSYDNFDRTRADNVVPTYESANSDNGVSSYVSDDFYGWMDSGEGAADIRAGVDVAIGRLPAVSVGEAEDYVAKVEDYVRNPKQGEWRAKSLFIGMSGDANEHVNYAELQAQNFEAENPDMEVVRVYSEAYPAVTLSTGTAFPAAAATARGVMETGCALVHFTGHSGAGGVGEDYLSKDYVARMPNRRMPFVFVSASCSVAKFDVEDGTMASAGLYNPAGGYLGVFAATRDVFGNGNYNVTRHFVKNLYGETPDGRRLTMGEAFLRAKSDATRSVNSLKFCLLGDPALAVATPLGLYVQVDSVNGVPLAEQTEPMRALARSTVAGSVRNAQGGLDASFCGTARVTIYDKRQRRKTSGVRSGEPYVYSEYATRLFSGTVGVEGGRFSASFVLPKDFDLATGFGRLHVYATGRDGRDAMGATDAVLVGDIAGGELSDTLGPTIRAWVDYARGADGAILGPTPYLYVAIADSQGVNVSGQGVGHDITLVVDGDRAGAVSLNDYFSYNDGSFVEGLVAYPLSALEPAAHTFTIKAWDILNNSSAVSFDINLDASSSAIRLSRHSVTLDDDLRLTILSDAFGETVSIRTCLYTLSGVLVAVRDEPFAQVNGGQQFSVKIAPPVVARGVYVLRCEVSGNGRKTEVARKILLNGVQ